MQSTNYAHNYVYSIKSSHVSENTVYTDTEMATPSNYEDNVSSQENIYQTDSIAIGIMTIIYTTN